MKRLLCLSFFVGALLSVVWGAPTFAADTAPATPAVAVQPTAPTATPVAAPAVATPVAKPVAVVDAAPATVPATAPAATEATPAPTVPDLVNGATQTYLDWTKLGWLAGLIALINLLLNLTKFGPVNEWFTVNKKKWLLPYVAAGLGAILGGLLSYQLKAPIPQCVFEGLMAGLGAIGGHEVLTKLRASKRTA